MFGQQLSDHISPFYRRNEAQSSEKTGIGLQGRAIDCMELEDRILLSASPIAPKRRQQTARTNATDRFAKSESGGRRRQRQSRRRLVQLRIALGNWVVNAQRFNAAGEPQGDMIQVSSQSSHEQQHATVAMNANGSFVITWTNKTTRRLFRRFRQKVRQATATLSADEIRVNSSTGDDPMNPSGGDESLRWIYRHLVEQEPRRRRLGRFWQTVRFQRQSGRE